MRLMSTHASKGAEQDCSTRRLPQHDVGPSGCDGVARHLAAADARETRRVGAEALLHSRTTLSLPKISTWSEVWAKVLSPTVLPQLARSRTAMRQRGRQRVRETTAHAGAPDHDGAIRAGIAGADAVDCAPERANASAAVSARCRPNTD